MRFCFSKKFLWKLEVSKDLKKIVSRLTLTTEKNFTQKLDEWYEKYKDFFSQRVQAQEMKKVFHQLLVNSIILIQKLEQLTEVWELIYLSCLLTRIIKICIFKTQLIHLKVEYSLTWRIWLVYIVVWVKVWS